MKRSSLEEVMNIGQTIARLRKEKNMTQSEVAEKLNVSYQAVSKWERDESLPDITLLPAIADLFEISIDQLLGRSFDMKKEEVEAAKQIIQESSDETFNNQVTEFVNQEFSKKPNIDSEELSDSISDYISKSMTHNFTSAFENLAPMIKPQKIRKILKRKNAHLNSFSKKACSYMDEETLEEFITSIDEMNEEDMDRLQELLPILGENTKDIVIEKLCHSDLNLLEMNEVLPFLNQAQIGILLEAYLETTDCEDIDEILPFLNAENRDQIVNKMIENEKCDDLDEVMSFLNASQKEKLVAKEIEKGHFEELSELAPFLNHDIMNEIIQGYIAQNSTEDLSDLYPFLNSLSKKALMKYYVENKMHDELEELMDYM